MEHKSRRLIPFLAISLLWSGLLIPPPLAAQTSETQPASPVTPPAEEPNEEADQAPDRFFDTITVSATLNPVAVKDTPGTVSVIGADAIARRMIENIADLVSFEPGVYIESNLTRVGLNGFNIRGIGGNRVMTQVDGIETSEQFDFGPFNMHQQSLDLDTVKTAEVVRSSGSALYGSDALGGVVSFFTKDPSDYLQGRRFHLAAKTLYDGRSSEANLNTVAAGGNQRLQGSLFVSYGSGHELRNKGLVPTEDATRAVPNPQDRTTVQALAKVTASLSDGNHLRAAIEIADSDVETQAYSSRGIAVLGPTTTNTSNVLADDTLKRRRASVEQTLVNRGGLNQWFWNLYVQASDTGQVVDEVRTTTGAGPAVTALRHGTMDYQQDSYGGAVQGRKLYAPVGQGLLLTFGGSYKQDTFDMLRDRVDINSATGATIPTTLILPTKYFPTSRVAETGAYVQAEMRFGRLTLVPGIRYDQFSLDADGTDPVFLASLSPAAADFSAAATSAKVGASFRVSDAVTVYTQYAGGFRAPPYSAVNSGFTNVQSGYTSLPNPDLEAETSDNVEVGVRSTFGPLSVGVTGFSNAYDNFIEQVALGVNAATRLLEYQNRNVSEVSIRGVEFQGEARLSSAWRLRASAAVIRGDNVSGDTDVPLSTIAPDQGVVGLEYAARSARWGSQATLRLTAEQSQSTAGPGLYAPEASAVLDLVGWAVLTDAITLRAGVLNITDATYFEWANVRGRSATDATIDRYSSPGRSGLVSVSYGW